MPPKLAPTAAADAQPRTLVECSECNMQQTCMWRPEPAGGRVLCKSCHLRIERGSKPNGGDGNSDPNASQSQMGLNQAADGKRVASTALPHGRVAKQARVSTAGESAASGEQPTRDPTRASNDDVDQTRLVQLCGTYDQAFASMVSAQAACDAVAKVLRQKQEQLLSSQLAVRSTAHMLLVHAARVAGHGAAATHEAHRAGQTSGMVPGFTPDLPCVTKSAAQGELLRVGDNGGGDSGAMASQRDKPATPSQPTAVTQPGAQCTPAVEKVAQPPEKPVEELEGEGAAAAVTGPTNDVRAEGATAITNAVPSGSHGHDGGGGGVLEGDVVLVSSGSDQSARGTG